MCGGTDEDVSTHDINIKSFRKETGYIKRLTIMGLKSLRIGTVSIGFLSVILIYKSNMENTICKQ